MNSSEINNYWPSSCEICGENRILVSTECRHDFCEDCLYSWISTLMKGSMIANELILTCPADKCDHKFSHEELNRLLSESNFREVDDLYLQRYLKNTQDVRFCPSANCSYAGVILPKPCSAQLECESCHTTWKDASQFTFMDKLSKFLSFKKDIGNEFCSDIMKMLLGQPCPNCESIIFKNGGCPHMNCAKCKFEFCWFCLQQYKGYKHNPDQYCGGRAVCGVILLLFILNIVNFKACFTYDPLCRFEKLVGYYIFIVLVTILYFGALILVGILLADDYRRNKAYAVSYSDSNHWARVRLRNTKILIGVYLTVSLIVSSIFYYIGILSTLLLSACYILLAVCGIAAVGLVLYFGYKGVMSVKRRYFKSAPSGNTGRRLGYYRKAY